MRKLYKYLVWIFLILALLSFFITIFDRFWIIKSKSDAQIINKKKTKGEVELIIQYGSESFYLYFDKTIDIPFKTNEYVELYYSKILDVPVAIKQKDKIIKGKFRFSGIIFIEIIVLFFMLSSCRAFRKRKTGEWERDNSLIDPYEFLFYLSSILVLVPWIYIFHKIFH